MSSDKAREFKERAQRNILDNKAIISQLFDDFKWVNPAKKERKKRTRRSLDPLFLIEPRRNPTRGARPDYAEEPPVLKRISDYKRKLSAGTCSEDDRERTLTKESSGSGRLFVKFNAGFTKLKASGDQNNNDDDDVKVYDENDENDEELDDEWENPRRKQRKRSARRVLCEVTEEDLKLVAVASSEKQYDPIDGTTCHQCRQKTRDTKTICRSEDCTGIRGMFCGPCLRNRYGEDALEALRDKAWTCPPCRGTCNCSICRRQSGKSCTGILVHHARQQGFSDVDSYLSQAERHRDDAE